MRAVSSSSTTASGKPIAYRPDLDGLRAIAVLSVVFFHFNLPNFGGGYVGVDIFFVISGYLITSIIVGGLEAGNFSFACFYERRIRRIIPALVVMLVAVSIAAIAMFPPKELAQFGLSAAAAAAFCSNIFFAFQTNYFAGPDTTMPLLHTWSLGVEEQFYILCPLLLFACFRMGSRLAVSVLVVILAVASLGYSEWGTNSKYASQLFYLLQSRAWELMFGAILALGLVPGIANRWLRDVLGLVGVGMIAFAVTQFSSVTPFPGLWATVPCIGALLVIHSGQQRDTAVYRLLGLQPLVFIGLISYSLYLWHWPVFAFAEAYIGRPISSGETLILIALSIALATASWRYVERPFRSVGGEATFSPRAYFVGGLGALGLAASVGGVIYLGDGLQGRLGPEALQVYLASRDHNPLRSECLGGSGPRPAAASRCTKPSLGSGDGYDIVVWGDSHADALFPAIAMIGEPRGLATRQVAKKACPPLLGAERVSAGWRTHAIGKSACARFNAALLQELMEGPRPGLVVIVARWSMYAETSTDFAGGRRVFLVDEQSEQLDSETTRKVLSRALARTVDAVTALGIRVLLIGQPPEFFQDPSDCFVERSILHRDVSGCLSQPRHLVDQRLQSSKEILREVAAGGSAASYVSLDSVLCDDQVCRTWQDGQPLYEDRSHIGLAGARVIGRALAEKPSIASLFAPWGTTSHAAMRGPLVH